MLHVNLNPRRAWTKCGAARATGRAFIGGRLHSAADLAAVAGACDTFEAFTNAVLRMNGHFALIVRRETGAWLACDRMRTIPLYYTVSGHPAVGDDDQAVIQAGGVPTLDPVSTEEFYLAGFVCGGDTRYTALKQVRSGETVEIRVGPGGHQAHPKRYWQFTQRDQLSGDIASLCPPYGEVLRRCVHRLIEVAAGRMIALPLSGGYDSRSLALTLMELGYDRVVAFSYGAADIDEVVVGREVAGQIGIPWHHIPYSNGLWHEWVRTPEWRAYQAFAGTAASLPHLQDWPALRHLVSAGVLDRDALFVPGYAGEVRTRASAGPAGVPVPDDDTFADTICSVHYSLWPWRREQRAVRRDIERRVLESVGPLTAFRTFLAAEEAFNMNERQAKFIANAVRSLDFWDLDWWLPLYDSEFMAFWEQAPHAARHSRALLYTYTDDLTRRLLPHPERLVDCGQRPDTQDAQRRTSRDRLRAALRPVAHLPVLKQVHDRRADRWARYIYAAEPLRWYGVVDEGRFCTAWRNGAGNINALLTAQLLGRMEFD